MKSPLFQIPVSGYRNSRHTAGASTPGRLHTLLSAFRIGGFASRKAKRAAITLAFGLAVSLVGLPFDVLLPSQAFFAKAQAAEGETESKAVTDARTVELLQLFGEVFEKVRSEYVEEVSDETLLYAAIQGMLNDLDPHSFFLDKKNHDRLRDANRGEFGGLGIEVTLDESGAVLVVSPIDDTPAFKVGLQAGDLITHLDGAAVSDLTLDQAVKRMRGQVGESITLTILRKGQDPFDVIVVRDVITVQAVKYRREGNVGYIRIASFSAQADVGVERAIERLSEGGDPPIGYIVDVRNNPGGLLDQAVSVVDLFLERGEIVHTRGRLDRTAQRFQARPGDAIEGAPLVILINGGSASASEILAGALQDQRRAVIVGSRTFGKGSVQTVIPIGRSGDALKLTTQRYYTPSGKSIQARGVDPDIYVPLARVEEVDESRFTQERDLENALDTEKETENENNDGDLTPGGANLSQTARTDYQLLRAIDLIRGLAIFRETEG